MYRFPDWVKNKKNNNKNSVNKEDNKCFQYDVTLYCCNRLNHEEIKNDP